MKSMKKIASLLLALAMIFALATTAFAAGTNSITVNSTKTGETYKLYKMLDLVVDNADQPTAFTYSVNTNWKDFFIGGEGAAYVVIENDIVTWNENKKSADDMILFGQAAAAYAKDESLSGVPKEASSDTVVFDGLEPGYYLITSTLGTKAIVDTTPAKPNPSIEEKNPLDTITKKVLEEDTNTWGKSNDAQIGDTINFESVATLQPYTRNVTIHDTMTEGLTFDTGSVKVEGLTEGTDYTVNENPNDGHTFDIVFTEAYLKKLTTANTTVKITYTATLNENAVLKDGAAGLTSQTNTTQITFGDKQSKEDQTTTTTHMFKVFKHATGSEDNLAGAVFSLKKGTGDTAVVVNLIKIDDNNYRVAKAGEDDAVATFTTVAKGDIVIWGVDADKDYTLKEITPPAGYNPLTEEKKVEVSATNDLVVDVENNTGTELPSTGGMGTTLFYVVGGILVAAAAVLLVTKKRMASAN